MGTIESLLDQLREALKEELRAEVRAELIAELGGGARPQAPKGKPKSLPAKLLKASPYSLTPGGSKATLKVKPGQRRGPVQIQEAATVLYDWLKKNPASRVDQASKALSVPVKDLQLPIAYLLEGKRISKKGKLRGTTYTVKG